MAIHMKGGISALLFPYLDARIQSQTTERKTPELSVVFPASEGIIKSWDYSSAQSWTCDMGCLHVNGSETKWLPPGPRQYFLIEISAINLYTAIASRLKDKIYSAVNHSGNFTLCFLSRACAVYNCHFLI